MNIESSYKVLQISLNSSIQEQEKIQTIEMREIIQQSNEIKQLSDAINDSLDEKSFTYSSS